jgi:Eco29kI restriction endonuclease
VLGVTMELFPEPSAEFKLSITRALADQLADALAQLRPAPLNDTEIDAITPRPGVYELFLREERVYVGKASGSITARLRNHLRKLSGRSNISLDDISFQCLYVDEDLEAAAPEKMLIKKYRDQGGAPWNTNGFGNKDPGRKRDHTLVKANHFDARYPINLDLRLDPIRPGNHVISEYLPTVKAALPFNLRFDSTSRALESYRDSVAQIASGGLTVRDLIQAGVEALPEGWQATALPGYVILYQEDTHYESALALWRKRTGVLRQIAGEPRFGRAGTIEEENADGE